MERRGLEGADFTPVSGVAGSAAIQQMMSPVQWCVWAAPYQSSRRKGAHVSSAAAAAVYSEVARQPVWNPQQAGQVRTRIAGAWATRRAGNAWFVVHGGPPQRTCWVCCVLELSGDQATPDDQDTTAAAVCKPGGDTADSWGWGRDRVGSRAVLLGVHQQTRSGHVQSVVFVFGQTLALHVQPSLPCQLLSAGSNWCWCCV